MFAVVFTDGPSQGTIMPQATRPRGPIYLSVSLAEAQRLGVNQLIQYVCESAHTVGSDEVFYYRLRRWDDKVGFEDGPMHDFTLGDWRVRRHQRQEERMKLVRLPYKVTLDL